MKAAVCRMAPPKPDGVAMFHMGPANLVVTLGSNLEAGREGLMTRRYDPQGRASGAVIKLQAKRFKETRIAMLTRGGTWLVSGLRRSFLPFSCFSSSLP